MLKVRSRKWKTTAAVRVNVIAKEKSKFEAIAEVPELLKAILGHVIKSGDSSTIKNVKLVNKQFYDVITELTEGKSWLWIENEETVSS